jgi:tetratricopeptide (TPR) repeat protein
MGSKFRKKMRKATNFDPRIPGSGCDCCDWTVPHGAALKVHNHGPSASDVIELASQTGDPRLGVELYKQAKELARKEIGAQRFFDNIGVFWQVPYTRPYMQATSSLAQILRMLGKNVESIEQFRELINLNPRDNQGNRWHFALALLDAAKDEPPYYDELNALLERYPEPMVTMVYTKALMSYEREGESDATFEAFKHAVSRNPHVAGLLSKRLNPNRVPDHFIVGSRDEAMGYVFEAQEQWQARPQAAKYLQKIQAEFGASSPRYALV